MKYFWFVLFLTKAIAVDLASSPHIRQIVPQNDGHPRLIDGSFDYVQDKRISRHKRENTEFLRLSNSKLEIELVSSLNSVEHDSISFAWDARVRNVSESQFSEVDVGFLVSYRAFATSSPIEKTFLLRSDDESLNFETSSQLKIDELLADTGYIVCFSIVYRENESIFFEEQTTTTSTSRTPELENDYPVFVNNLRGVQPSHRFPNFRGSPFVGESFHGFPNSRPTTQRTTREGNYAYTNTGEFVYLPSSQWRPNERRRKREALNEDDKICQEVVTKSKFPLLLNPINAAFIGAFLAILILLYLILNLITKREICCVSQKKKFKKEGETSHENRSTMTDFSFIGDDLERTKNLFPDNVEIGMIPRVSRCQCEKIGKNALPLPKKKSVFHPGYELPPNSAMKFFGYDLPNKTWIKNSAPKSVVKNAQNRDLSLRKSVNTDFSSNNSSEFSKVKEVSVKNQSVGDIVVTGGTLIEVPEGYAKPKRNPQPVSRNVQSHRLNSIKVLRILVGGGNQSSID